MAERVKSLEEIKDPEAFLNAHYGALEDITRYKAELEAARTEMETIKEQYSEENISKWRDKAIAQHARAALVESGIKNPDRILKYMKLDGVDFDDKDNLVGFDEKFTEVKSDFPELFDPKTRAGRTDVDIHAGGESKAAKDPFREAVRSALGK